MADFRPTQRRTQRKRRRMVLGYTRSGKTVHRPSHEISSDHHVLEKLSDWTPGDHSDAWRILAEHGEREPDREIGAWCADWAVVHKRLGGR